MPEDPKFYYLRIEAVNLDHFIYDTDDLSTIRGGGLLLLNWPRQFDPQDTIDDSRFPWPEGAEPEVISRGASSGLFRFKAKNDEAAEQCRDGAMAYLTKHEQLSHATFVADIQADHGENQFHTDAQFLLAKNRWRQMQQLTLTTPERRSQDNLPRNNDGEDYNGPCQIDGIRPAAHFLSYGNEDKRFVSESVRCRREYGRSQKRVFYREQLEPLRQHSSSAPTPHDWETTWDFEQLSTRSGGRRALDGKMAVIYIDGNHFGSIQTRTCTSRELQRKWDAKIQNNRRIALKRLFDVMEGDPDWYHKVEEKNNQQLAQLETLLWGGDDLLWVVPAWKGWQTLKLFYQPSNDLDWTWQSKPLTHAAGLVFCNHKAPIQRIIQLAKDLADGAKRAGRERNSFSYQVMESFDHLGQDLNLARKRWLPIGADMDHLVLHADNMCDLQDDLINLRDHFPRRQLYRVLAIYQDNHAGGIEVARKNSQSALNQIIAELHEDVREKIAAICEKAQKQPAYWLHYAELWDYVDPDHGESANG